MTTIELSEIGAGFHDISLGSQNAFRSALEALSYPGRKVPFKVTFEAPVRDATKGQAAVFYQGELMVGGGIIK